MRREISRKRCLLGATMGALGSLVIFLPSMPFVMVLLEKTALCAAITFISFGKQRFSDFAVSGLFFLTVNFIFAGLMLALWTFACPYGMYCENGVCTFDIPLGAVAAFTIAAYFTVKLMRFFSDKRLRAQRICTVKILCEGTVLTLRGLCDTGCEVRDILSGIPIVVCNCMAISDILPYEIRSYLNGECPDMGSLRLVPFNTASSKGLLPVFRVENVLINDKPVDAYVGAAASELGSDIDCVFNPKILSI